MHSVASRVRPDVEGMSQEPVGFTPQQLREIDDELFAVKVQLFEPVESVHEVKLSNVRFWSESGPSSPCPLSPESG